MLSKINRDPRDDLILFEEKTHTYTFLPMRIKLVSVTTLIHGYFPKFNSDEVISRMMNSKNWINSKYYSMSRDEIKKQWEDLRKNAARLGIQMHTQIENYFNQNLTEVPSTPEFSMFLDFWGKFNQINSKYKPYRTEWIIYDEDAKVAGTIDFVLSDKEGNLILIDWKRSKEIKRENPFQKGFPPLSHLDDCNFNHYSLQLNIYRHILETKYNRRVLAMFIVVFHPDQKGYQFINVERNETDTANLWKFHTK